MSASYTYDAYRDKSFRNPLIADLFAGRHLTRLFWHLQQQWLLGSRWDKPYSKNPVWKAQYRQATGVRSVFTTLALLPHSLEVKDEGTLHRAVLEVREDWEELNAFGQRQEEVDEAIEKCMSSLLDDAHLVTCQSLIRHRIQPLHIKLQSLFRDELDERHRQVFKLGECVERGLCRHDVCEHLLQCGAWYELSERDKRWAEAEELAKLDSWEAGGSSDHVESARTLAEVCREPGDLAPEQFWLRELPLLWELAELREKLPQAFHKFRSAYRKATVTKESLCELVAVLHATACEALVRIPGDQDSTPRLIVQHDPPTATLDGVRYSIDRDAAIVLQESLDAGSNVWVPFSEVRQKHLKDFGKHDRIGRIVKRMPKELAQLIQTQLGAGYRLQLDRRA